MKRIAAVAWIAVLSVPALAYSYDHFTFCWLARCFAYIQPEPGFVCRTYSDNVYEWPRSSRCLNLWYKLGADSGTTWRFVLDGGEPCYSPLFAAIGSRSQTVSVPAGELVNCMQVVHGHGCSDAGLEAEPYPPVAGLIKRVETTLAGPVETVLTDARVDGEMIPGHHLLDGPGALVGADAPSYTKNLLDGIPTSYDRPLSGTRSPC